MDASIILPKANFEKRQSVRMEVAARPSEESTAAKPTTTIIPRKQAFPYGALPAASIYNKTAQSPQESFTKGKGAVRKGAVRKGAFRTGHATIVLLLSLFMIGVISAFPGGFFSGTTFRGFTEWAAPSARADIVYAHTPETDPADDGDGDTSAWMWSTQISAANLSATDDVEGSLAAYDDQGDLIGQIDLSLEPCASFVGTPSEMAIPIFKKSRTARRVHAH